MNISFKIGNSCILYKVNFFKLFILNMFNIMLNIIKYKSINNLYYVSIRKCKHISSNICSTTFMTYITINECICKISIVFT